MAKGGYHYYEPLRPKPGARQFTDEDRARIHAALDMILGLSEKPDYRRYHAPQKCDPSKPRYRPIRSVVRVKAISGSDVTLELECGHHVVRRSAAPEISCEFCPKGAP